MLHEALGIQVEQDPDDEKRFKLVIDPEVRAKDASWRRTILGWMGRESSTLGERLLKLVNDPRADAHKYNQQATDLEAKIAALSPTQETARRTLKRRQQDLILASNILFVDSGRLGLFLYSLGVLQLPKDLTEEPERAQQIDLRLVPPPLLNSLLNTYGLPGNRYETLFGRYDFRRSKRDLTFGPDFSLVSNYAYVVSSRPFRITIRDLKEGLAAAVFLGDDQSGYKGLGQSAQQAYRGRKEDTSKLFQSELGKKTYDLTGSRCDCLSVGLERYVEKANVERIMPLIPQADHLDGERHFLTKAESLNSLMPDQTDWYALLSDGCLIVRDHLAFLDEAQSYDVASVIELGRSTTPEVQLGNSTAWPEAGLDRYYSATPKERSWMGQTAPVMIDTYRGLSMSELEGGRVILRIWYRIRKTGFQIPNERIGSVEYRLSELPEAALAELAAEVSSLGDIALRSVSPESFSDHRLLISWKQVGAAGQLRTVVTLFLAAERNTRLHVPAKMSFELGHGGEVRLR
ncbi:MAG: hypothetical protein H6534_10065 [Chthonomonadaceae bacterium]|nr:hypothetical protein [Chthonomonadaceae bacterium]